MIDWPTITTAARRSCTPIRAPRTCIRPPRCLPRAVTIQGAPACAHPCPARSLARPAAGWRRPFGQQLGRGGAEAAVDRVVLDRDPVAGPARGGDEHLLVEWFDRGGVDDLGVDPVALELLRGFERVPDGATARDQ